MYICICIYIYVNFIAVQYILRKITQIISVQLDDLQTEQLFVFIKQGSDQETDSVTVYRHLHAPFRSQPALF